MQSVTSRSLGFSNETRQDKERQQEQIIPIDTETIEKFISNISRSLEELGQSEISTNTIGTMVMDGLKDLDPVGYVRFASVYRNFREEKDFVQFVDKLDVYKKR